MAVSSDSGRWITRASALLLAAGLIGGLAACAPKSPFHKRADLVAAPSPCGPKRFDIYFAENQARLTDAARQAIGLTATQLQSCNVRRVQVLGLASATGAASANLSLSEQRARAVTEAMEAAGWPAPAFTVEAAGDQGAVSESGAFEPLRRRTEVLVEASPR